MVVIAEQIIILAIISIIGYIAFKVKAVNAEHNNGLVKIIIKITLPLLVFTSFAGAEPTREMISNFPFIIAVAFLSVFVFYFLSTISAKAIKLDKENTALHNAQTMFGNTVFLGYPLLNAVYPGGEGLMYAVIFHLGHDCLVWTWGIYILNKSSKIKKTNTFLNLINPTTISFLTGIIFLIFKIKLPEIIFNPISAVGHTTIYLSMIYVGIILAQVRAKSLISNFRSYVLSFNKLILGPIILCVIFYVLQMLGLEISEKALVSSILQAAMPCMIIISVMAKDMELNATQAVENIFVSTVLSLITLPVIFYLVSFVFT